MKTHSGNVAIFVPHMGCGFQCSFCNQNTISGEVNAPTPQSVKKTVMQALEIMGEKASNSEIAFFGGSFTAIGRAYMISLLEAASEFVGENGFMGIRISTRPDCIDEETLEILSRYGVTAIELGAQSTDDEVLAANNRGHSSEDIYNASMLIKRFGGFTLGLQMMTGLYKDTTAKSLKTASDIIHLEADTVRIYPTAVIKGTKLAELYAKGEYKTMSLDEQVELCAKLLMMFTKAGVSVIRMGLHNSEELANDMVGGTHHPAFRELCENKIMLWKAVEQIKAKGIKKGNLVCGVNASSVSKLIGQKRCNAVYLAELGYKLKVKQDNSLGYLELACS